MEIQGEKFKVLNVFDTAVTVPDCMVMGKNKLGTAHGEAKLYISSKKRMRKFFGSEGFNAKCFVLKKDLLGYMEAIKHEYFCPSLNYRGRDNMKKLWEERKRKVEHFEDVIEFNVQDQVQIRETRGYVNSTDRGYKLLREISLPLVSYITMMQVAKNGDNPIFYWKLFADFDIDKRDALVFKYGQKKEEEKLEKEDKKANKIRDARNGQGVYREKLLEECPFCPITMINDERLLIASHIKPWAVSNDKEKIDPKNGFMLSPLYDKLFDRGFITFTDDRHVLISNWLSPLNKQRIGIKEDDYIQLLPLDDERKAYLKFHRQSVFKG